MKGAQVKALESEAGCYRGDSAGLNKASADSAVSRVLATLVEFSCFVRLLKPHDELKCRCYLAGFVFQIIGIDTSEILFKVIRVQRILAENVVVRVLAFEFFFQLFNSIFQAVNVTINGANSMYWHDSPLRLQK